MCSMLDFADQGRKNLDFPVQRRSSEQSGLPRSRLLRSSISWICERTRSLCQGGNETAHNPWRSAPPKTSGSFGSEFKLTQKRGFRTGWDFGGRRGQASS